MAPLLRGADALLFDAQERGPEEKLRLQFEAVQRLDPEEQKVVISVLESILVKNESRRWMLLGTGA